MGQNSKYLLKSLYDIEDNFSICNQNKTLLIRNDGEINKVKISFGSNNIFFVAKKKQLTIVVSF